MHYIFYDLETSGLNRVNQILNYAFVVVNADFKTIDTLRGDVKVSRLQLPQAGAIKATKINILEHQAKAEQTEAEAVDSIAAFFRKHKGSTLIGYNSSDFDLPFLRTVFIRNGVSPYKFYFSFKDLLTSTRFLLDQGAFESENAKLEGVTKALGLLEGEQEHESFADVQLTVELTREYIKRFKHDARTFDYYQVSHLHDAPRGSVFMLDWVYTKRTTFPAVLLDSNKRYALWIDLSEKEKIRWVKFAENLLFENKTEKPTAEQVELGEQMLEKFKGVNLENYFTDSSCHIEEDIYRLDIDAIETLGRSIRSGEVPPDAPSDFKQLFQRYALENNPNSSLKRYAKYRYGGQLELKNGSAHPTLEEMYAEIEEFREKEPDLMQALKEFYDDSEIVAVFD